MTLDGIDDAKQVLAGGKQRDDHAEHDQAGSQPAPVEIASPGGTEQHGEDDGDRGNQQTETNRRRHRPSLENLERALTRGR